MAETKNLIQSMAACDGRNINCEGCPFREHPDCRNAMARHGAAVLNLQDVVIDNTTAMMAKIANDREKIGEDNKIVRESHGKLYLRLQQLYKGLSAERHCNSCGTLSGMGEAEAEKYCKACREGESLWNIDTNYGKPIPEDDGAADDTPEGVQAEPVGE